MKFSTFLGAVFCGLVSLVSFNASAAQTTQWVGCSWANTSVMNNGSVSVIYDQCTSGVYGVIAKRSRAYTSYGNNCGIYDTTYSYTGSCESPSFYKIVTTPDAVCGPNHGQAYNGGQAFFVGQNTPFPTAAVESFCGSCGYTVQTVTTYTQPPYGSRVTATCK